MAEFRWVELPGGREFPLSALPDPEGLERDYRLNPKQLFKDYPGARLFRSNPLTSGGERKNQSLPYLFQGKEYSPGRGNCWKTTVKTDDGSIPGMNRLEAARRLIAGSGQLRFKSYLDDFGYGPLSNWWDSLGGASDPIYVVQTNTEVVQRCILMTTDPGTWCSTLPAALERQPVSPSNGGGAGSHATRHAWPLRWLNSAS